MNFNTILKLALMRKTICSFSIIVFILHFNPTPVQCENVPYSMIKIYIQNKTFEMKAPIDIWFNDSLVVSQAVLDKGSAAYKLFSKGNLRITTQIRGFENTRCEYALNILNEENYVIVIKFESTSQSGSVFGLKKTDGKNYESYFEENLFKELNIDKDSIFTKNGLNEKIITHDYSICHLILLNKTFNSDPIKIWINDQLIMNQYILINSTINCKFFTEGVIKIAAQLGNLRDTKTELEFEISNKQSNFLLITFRTSNKAATITLLNQEEGPELFAKKKLNWTATEIFSADLTNLVEDIDNPIPSMYYNNDYRAFQEQNTASERLNLKDSEYFVDNRDGQIYRTVKIGNQVWMAENLRATRYLNGDQIPNLTDNKQWSEDTLGAYCDPNNYTENAEVYGRLYNFYAVTDPRGLAPEGWHVATVDDWRTLIDELDKGVLAGIKMQEIDLNNFWRFRGAIPTIILKSTPSYWFSNISVHHDAIISGTLVPFSSVWDDEDKLLQLNSDTNPWEVNLIKNNATLFRFYVQESDTSIWKEFMEDKNEFYIEDIALWLYLKNNSNISGFTALPVGCRVGITGEFSWLGETAYWLAIKPDKPNYVGFYSLSKISSSINHDMFAFKRKSFGYSVRCVKD